MKRIGIITVVVVILCGAILLGRNAIVKVSVQAGVKAMTGLTLEMRAIKIGVLNTFIRIEGLRLLNPSNFPDALMMYMPDIYVKYKLDSFLKGEVHLEEIRLHLAKFIVVRDKDGVLNLDSLKVVKDRKQATREDAAKKQLKIQIDVLELRIGKVIYKDYSRGRKPRIREYNVNINERYENIDDPQALVSIIVVKALMNTTISSLANFDIGFLQDGITGILKGATKLAADAAGKTLGVGVYVGQGAAKAVVGTAGKAVDVGKDIGGKVTDTTKTAVKKGTDAVKKLLPFGN